MKALVLKTSGVNASQGSNPCPSAIAVRNFGTYLDPETLPSIASFLQKLMKSMGCGNALWGLDFVFHKAEGGVAAQIEKDASAAGRMAGACWTGAWPSV